VGQESELERLQQAVKGGQAAKVQKAEEAQKAVERVTIRCPKCGRTAWITMSQVGEQVGCPECKGMIETAAAVVTEREARELANKKVIEAARRKVAETEGLQEDVGERFLSPGSIVLMAIGGTVLCWIAGGYLLSIEAASKQSILESIAHGIGFYCLGKGCFVGPALWVMARRLYLAELEYREKG